jgi:hypothetical protein
VARWRRGDGSGDGAGEDPKYRAGNKVDVLWTDTQRLQYNWEDNRSAHRTYLSIAEGRR